MTKKISVGIADMKIARQEGELITYALGSCIGVAFYDPMIKLGALLHIMLPEKIWRTVTYSNMQTPESRKHSESFRLSER